MIRLFFRSLTPALTLASMLALAACGGHEADSTVTVLMVVPLHKYANLLPRSQQAFKRLARISRSVFQGLEQRFRVRIIVADRRATE